MEMREAREPARTFGSRVQRQLRARWFSLVPLKRRALAAIVAILMGGCLLLSLGHHIAVTWPSIAHRDEIARTLILNRPDSLGTWVQCVVLMVAAGASFLIYQLRLYRNDDYRGHYRLWRLVLIVLILASINAQVGLVRWAGAVIDAGLGKRVAMAGADWLRIVLGVGGTVLAMRLIAEVNRCRGALIMMLGAAGFLALPEAGHWRFIDVTTPLRSTIIMSAPLIGYSLFLSACITYLRQLYRQARNLPEEPILEKIKAIPLTVFRPDEERYDDEPDEPVHEDDVPGKKKRSWFRRRGRQENDLETNPKQDIDDWQDDQAASDEEEIEAEDTPVNEEPEAEEESKDRPKRRWFGLRKAKPIADDAGDDEDDETLENNEHADSGGETDDESSKPKKKGWFSSFRLRPDRTIEDDEEESDVENELVDEPSGQTEDPDEEVRPKKGLMGWLSRKNKTASDVESDDESSDVEEQPANAAQAARHQSAQDAKPAHPARQSQPSSDEDDIDPDDIDWNSMSKSERRRLRKKLKRMGKAA